MDEYLKELENHLKKENITDIQEIISYYAEYLKDATITDYQSACYALGAPEAVAKKIVIDGILDNQESELESYKKLNNRFKSKVIWTILLVLISLPITIPILLSVTICIAASYVVMTGALLSLLIIFVGSFVTGIITFFSYFPAGFVYLGLSSLSLGIFVTLIPLAKWMIDLIFRFCLKIYRKFYSKQRGAVV